MKPISKLAAEHAQWFPRDLLPMVPLHEVTREVFTRYRDYHMEQINEPVRSCPTALFGGVLVQVGPARVVGVVEGIPETSVTFVTARGNTAGARLIGDEWRIVEYTFTR